ncbi:MAG: hypothetical protein A3J65_04245 [Candidatus Buchananbacteria bacterium RIFCSPHIGHO2_02_FULL_45_11b]|uniref:Uncharacterized protein n=1 Tax=Candidatus Buchananbacteria bacterium RIFCSPHIGHO2_02_FULL_45_11b TaxID=1797541 RepID=A0A1G1YCJ4_9BACT|nr:MAG: hypothetical protein A3J65_04245 [Candidatus Buchananbacteria bacterium RIFCSPHIGHO2_02_FULL_45_11b]
MAPRFGKEGLFSSERFTIRGLFKYKIKFKNCQKKESRLNRSRQRSILSLKKRGDFARNPHGLRAAEGE